MPVVSIAEIDGRVGGGGAELAASFDMRFGSVEHMVLNQMEVPLGILPGGSGTQRIPHLVGRGRAMEIILGAVAIDATTAAAWGWLNRALPATELRHHVERLAGRIASFPPHAVQAAKASVLAALPDPTEGLLAEANLFAATMQNDRRREAMAKFLQLGGQTREAERDMETLTAHLTDRASTD
jgi:enoyl-CoA hydratase/carnithine racemase